MEKAMIRTGIVILAAGLVVAASAGASGPAEPLILRTVTLHGVTSPAYYSRVEGGYRFVGGPLRGPSLPAPDPMLQASAG
jgi:hypothetical protein